ncbi:sulfurtransferase [Alkalihalobacillus alcalophilus ATCC 27647 = CGMCC 1.3604]|uniref:Sulfurtransferase n=1 Tax=Alkalihalobacillus alcalophilus ATCC 27647 = CGMCC 1.3604 TaxID=1218173 RepID=A0A094WN21_ALKAL|nr:rhodanese-like domain-containing protein [Alkalihalobacillus alcalophilus]KGA97363.1 sulfurtransferase [Alkalihalobacillus alcalophilus ATCC 27647 = CGMCC 1.3604]MED1562096.1 rhodanese-like domain-containing protein [Alkalihalobacillus alcalophilus]THG88368.1 sulfurtransferase [Alkalihalobacillus alcalophilus ATCC 27647 = CGMCC 1.3604]
MSVEQDGVKQIKEDELKELLGESNKERVFIDVREVEEYDEFHIPGVPLIPMNTIPNHVQDLDKDKEYVLICRSGGRSQNVALYLKEQGFEKVANFNGGMLSWTGETKEGQEWIVEKTEELYK